MTYFLKSGNSYKPTSEAALDIHEKLPVGTYIIKADVFGNMFLDLVENFEVNFKRYGDNVKHTDRIISTFLDRSVSTGVMLAGEKGSGKSLLAKTVSIEAAKLGIPTILINVAWCGEQFNEFIQQINQPAVILFDEFEKVYDSDQQEQILTLLDGVFPTKKLFVLTCNDKWRVDTHMRNRPGRIFYMLDFEGLDENFIREYCEDNLINKENIEGVCKVSLLYTKFNFDMLKAVVEEMNRYNETAQESMFMLNAKPEFDTGKETYDIELVVDGVRIRDDLMERLTYTGNPISNTTYIEYKEYESGSSLDPENGDWEWVGQTFNPKQLKSIDVVEGKFVFVNDAGNICTFKKQKPDYSSYWNAF